MFRRTLFKSILSGLALQFVPRWARAESTPKQESSSPSLYDLALVVLPTSLGPARISEIAANFEKWIAGYPSGADAGNSYGSSNLRVLGPNPSSHYAEQIVQIGTIASAKGAPFAQLNDEEKRAVIRTVLAEVGASSIPQHPNGLHVITDLMSYFYNSSDGTDFCYNAAIRRADCRGLASSGSRPASLS